MDILLLKLFIIQTVSMSLLLVYDGLRILNEEVPFLKIEVTFQKVLTHWILSSFGSTNIMTKSEHLQIEFQIEHLLVF